MKLLHVTAHLGGGVGRVLSRLAEHRHKSGGSVEATYVCLEAPQDRRAADVIAATGAAVVFEPSPERLKALIADSDIVQLEWWHHPLMAKTLRDLGEIRARLVVWAHVSGLHYPAFPAAFLAAPHAFLFTTPVSERFARGGSCAVVNSSGGFDDLPPLERDEAGPARFGYLGALNPAKMHPAFVDFVRAVTLPGFTLDIYGDASVNPALAAADEPRLRLRGFVAKPLEALSSLDVLAYLLNPSHYGTTENALLEAMACGVVPVVLDNPVESLIVEDGETGLIVRDPADFAQAVRRLAEDAPLRRRLSRNAATRTREKYSIGTTSTELERVYDRVIGRDKTSLDFAGIFGSAPADIFRACLGDYAALFTDDSARGDRMKQDFIYDASKSSIFQFRKYFPEDAWLESWAARLAEERAQRSS